MDTTRRAGAAAALLAAVTLAGCNGSDRNSTPEAYSDTTLSPGARAAAPSPVAAPVATARIDPAERRAFFGDLHIHTRFSFDAWIFGTRTTPDDAYRFARGEGIRHPAGFEMKMEKPLDFLAVTDHASYLGMLPAMFDPDSRVGRHPVAVQLREADTPAERSAAFQGLIPRFGGQISNDDLIDRDVMRSAWQEIIESAERNNDPGEFTTFIAYEYTSSGGALENLHRNVFFRGADVPEDPFSRLDSLNPEDLWSWMDRERDGGRDAIAIPHNSNGSDGMMFELVNWADEPIDEAYAEQRMRNEPLVEVTQVKGTSDTHPALSPNDEWADFEIMPVRIASTLQSRPAGSYVREAYLNGLALEARGQGNPYKFGLIGSSDTHVAAGSFDEDRFWSKVGLLDATPQQRGSVPMDDAASASAPGGAAYREVPRGYAPSYYHFWSASGLAGVWADANTRDAIFEAFRRKETFATSGPRMKVRFFAGHGFAEDLATRPDGVATAYATGVPMGADLAADAGGAAPRFLVHAMRDPDEAPLQRLQIVKGWIEGGEKKEEVYDVACSDGGVVDPTTRRCPDNGARVNLADCTITAGVGADELATVWVDPDHVPGQEAFYYVRALQNPTCRWSTWDAVRANVAPRPDLHATIQERAWSSPIWVTAR
ncbi:MAG: DUF3604 domain-containing protein [Pseudomonadales bacterium]|jgi:hypothetical protein|nr:DUF3604 domain-containing protein [Pseudomonadales bacterium]